MIGKKEHVFGDKMNYENYLVLTQLEEELNLKRDDIDQKINENILKIKESNLYIASLKEKENEDDKIFSPRNSEIDMEEIKKAEYNRLSCVSENKYLTNIRNVISSRVERIHKVLESEKNVSNNLLILSIQEEDRQRIARELHDTSLQNLAHLVHKLELASLFIDQDPVRAKLELSVVNKNLKDIIDEIRCIIFDLRPMTFDDLGLKAALEKLICCISERNEYHVDSCIEEIHCDNSLVLLTIYRVAKECLINITKHANADQIVFHCKCKDNRCIIYIEDNGKGFDINKLDETKNKHFGIPVIRERIHLIGGKIDMKSKINKGTQIKIEVPLIF